MRMNAGMTLLEIMVVMVIIGLIGTLVGVSVFGALERADIKAARIQVGNIQQACDLYRLDNKKYPASLQDLAAGGTRPYMNSIPKDPWGAEYGYRNPGTQNKGGIDAWSPGPDGQEGNADDVGNWNLEESDKPGGP